jgi:DNA-binding phage protein
VPIELTPFDAVEELKNDPGGMAPFLHFAFQSDDPPHIVKAIGIVARAKGIDLPEIEDDPTLSTLILVLNRLGYRLTVEAIVAI